jgi:CBS domain-containing protein
MVEAGVRRSGLTVGEVMTPAPTAVGESSPVRDVRERVRSHGGAAVPVVDGDGRPVGVIAAADLFEGIPPDLPVRMAMTRRVRPVEAGVTVAEAARLLRQERVHHLVVTRRGRIVGVLSSFDLLGLLERLVDDGRMPRLEEDRRAVTPGVPVWG